MGLSSASISGKNNCGAGGVNFVDGFPDSCFSVIEVVFVPIPQVVKDVVKSCNFARSSPGMAVTGRLCPSRLVALQAGYPAGHSDLVHVGIHVGEQLLAGLPNH